MKLRSRWLALGASLAMSVVLVPSAPAVAKHEATLEIQVGAYLETAPAESMKFFPDEITVHKGDTLKFVGEFHTATMLPTDVDVDEWLEENANELGDAEHFISGNPDSEAYPWKLKGFTGNPDCGAPDDPCSHTGAEITDSGILFNYADFSDPNAPPTITGFNVVVDANPGDEFWVYCRIHPNMRMKVTVAGPNDDSTTQEDIDAAKADSLSDQEEEASALHADLSARRESTVRPNGTRVWEAWAGYDTEDFSLVAMYPRRLNVRKGDSVNWNFDQLHHESHTVTHPVGKALQVANTEPVLCDPNGDDTEGGETQPDFSQGFPACPEGSEAEIIVTEKFALPEGDGVVRSRTDYENSGVRGQLGDPPAPGVEPYSLKFVKPSKKANKYLCLIHPFMRGRIRVRK